MAVQIPSASFSFIQDISDAISGCPFLLDETAVRFHCSAAQKSQQVCVLDAEACIHRAVMGDALGEVELREVLCSAR